MGRTEDGVVYTPEPLAMLAASQLYQYQDIARKHGAKRYGGRTVLDPCCGEGALLAACRRIDSRAACLGIDIDAEAVARAKANGFEAEVCDLFKLPVTTEPPGHLLICNPPYVGRSNLRRIVGDTRFIWLKETYSAVRSGSCDLAGYVLRHVLQRWRPVISTWIVTNTIAQGSTRRVGLQWALSNGFQIVSALKNIPWPEQATVTIHVITIVDTVAFGGGIPKDVCEYVPHYKL